ncbi:hypothetical protein ACS6ZM_04005 [Streptococcus suis]
MDNWQLFVILALGIILLLTLTTLWLVLEEDDPEYTPIISQEEAHLVEFLETRQAINKDFLVAQKELLDVLKHEWRDF